MENQEQQIENVATLRQQSLEAKYISIERRSSGDTVFLVDDISFRSSMPKPTHWSVAWADLMMTMFVLFLAMFVYKAANQDFLSRQGLEVVGGDTAAALDFDSFNQPGVPFTPISPGLPLMASGKMKKAESITLRDLDVDEAFTTISDKTQLEKEIVELPADVVIPAQPTQSDTGLNQPLPEETLSGEAIIEVQPLTVARKGKPEKIEELYRLSKAALKANNLGTFAAVDLIPDNAMRIILTSDLFFDTGQAEITPSSQLQLEQLATSIQTTPYMINVVGHTDNVPMYSDLYSSNWELSVARASTVARFLIEDMGMNPNQFVVSGYASYRPLVPNTTTENRKMNRRVEVIISKRLPNPVPADQQNLN